MTSAFRALIRLYQFRQLRESRRHRRLFLHWSLFLHGDKNERINAVVDLGEGPGGATPPPPLILGKKEEMTEARRAGWVSKIKPGPLLSSKSGSATEMRGPLRLFRWRHTFNFVFITVRAEFHFQVLPGSQLIKKSVTNKYNLEDQKSQDSASVTPDPVSHLASSYDVHFSLWDRHAFGCKIAG